MTEWLLVAPVVLALLTGTVAALMMRWPKLSVQVIWVGAVVQVIMAVWLLVSVLEHGIVAVSVGSWPAPFGISFVADNLSAAMVLITAIIGLATVAYASADLSDRPSYPLYQVLIQILLVGVYGSFLTGDIFNLYVWFEVMLISSFGLMILDANRVQIEGAVKYVILNLVSTLVFLLAIGLLHGATGTLNMADLSLKVPLMDSGTTTLIASLFLFGFAIKSALFPVFAWLPASYHTLPSGVVAIFAGLLTKVGVYALMRVFTLVFSLPETGLQPLLVIIAGFTMLTGVLGAASQFEIKRILSFHIISQIGYMVMGLALFTPLAIAGGIFYIIHHIIVKANLFLIGGYLQRKHGSDNLGQLGGTYKALPWLGVLFIIPAFSLAGFPPLSGFWGKFMVIRASLETSHYLLAATALFVGLMTIFSMTKIWSEAFWKARPEGQINEPMSRRDHWLYLTPIVVLATLTIIIGLAVEPLYQFADTAAQQMLDSTAYVDAVMGVRP
ncbi:MAG: proton-conducting transporter transmembrane domain-containing protein [Saccharospirillum sp.]